MFSSLLTFLVVIKISLLDSGMEEKSLQFRERTNVQTVQTMRLVRIFSELMNLCSGKISGRNKLPAKEHSGATILVLLCALNSFVLQLSHVMKRNPFRRNWQTAVGILPFLLLLFFPLQSQEHTSRRYWFDTIYGFKWHGKIMAEEHNLFMLLWQPSFLYFTWPWVRKSVAAEFCHRHKLFLSTCCHWKWWHLDSRALSLPW